MYSIFNSRTKKVKYLEEGEPPPKKIVTEGDMLIKKLADNQQKTDISLAEHLNQRKEFVSSETYTNITGHISGTTDLPDFQLSVADINEISTLKSRGLTSNDIKIYNDYVRLGSEFWNNYKEVNTDALRQHLNEILQLLKAKDCLESRKTSTDISRHQEEYLNSLKPQSVETKLLKFATKNESRLCNLPSPMDEMPTLEKQIMQNIEEFSKCDVKKIRKKARSLGNKIQNLNKTIISPVINVTQPKLKRKTQWDVKDSSQRALQKVEIQKKNKTYTCQPQNWYTIKDGEIIKLNKDKTDNSNKEKSKLTINEIKNISKFSNYETGSPSPVIFLKNLRNKVTEDLIKNILNDIPLGIYGIKMMKGRMKGQAFVKFHNEAEASVALEALNGILVEGQPIIAQYGKKKS